MELDIIAEAGRTIATYPVSRAFDSADPHQYLVMPWFDGTWNDRDTMDIDTNPAELQRLMEGQNRRVFAPYYVGVGTSFGTEWFGGATGAGMTNRMHAAYSDMVEWANNIYQGDPEAQFILGTGGFSRGATTARMFANYAAEHGIPQLDSARTLLNDNGVLETTYDRYIVEPKAARIGTMVLFDTVSTGFGDLYNLSIPRQAENVLHLTALDEYRSTFPLRSAIDPANPNDPRILEIALPGAHSDIGGSYDRGGLADQYLRNFCKSPRSDPLFR